jgi:hypothetical protein
MIVRLWHPGTLTPARSLSTDAADLAHIRASVTQDAAYAVGDLVSSEGEWLQVVYRYWPSSKAGEPTVVDIGTQRMGTIRPGQLHVR